MTYPAASKEEYLKAVKEGVQHMIPLNVTREDYLKVVKEGVKEAMLSEPGNPLGQKDIMKEMLKSMRLGISDSLKKSYDMINDESLCTESREFLREGLKDLANTVREAEKDNV